MMSRVEGNLGKNRIYDDDADKGKYDRTDRPLVVTVKRLFTIITITNIFGVKKNK